jgi:hypothetical protein
MWLVCPERSTPIVRILITVWPQMYRQAIALAVHTLRPLHEVRIAPPQAARAEIARFRPHLIVRTDDDGLGPEALAGVPSRVELLYTDSMATRIALDGRTDEEIPDARLDDLLAAIDETGGLVPANGG